MGFPDPAVSTGLVHQLLFALPNLVCATLALKFYAAIGVGSR